MVIINFNLTPLINTSSGSECSSVLPHLICIVCQCLHSRTRPPDSAVVILSVCICHWSGVAVHSMDSTFASTTRLEIIITIERRLSLVCALSFDCIQNSVLFTTNLTLTLLELDSVHCWCLHFACFSFLSQTTALFFISLINFNDEFLDTLIFALMHFAISIWAQQQHYSSFCQCPALYWAITIVFESDNLLRPLSCWSIVCSCI